MNRIAHGSAAPTRPAATAGSTKSWSPPSATAPPTRLPSGVWTDGADELLHGRVRRLADAGEHPREPATSWPTSPPTRRCCTPRCTPRSDWLRARRTASMRPSSPDARPPWSSSLSQRDPRRRQGAHRRRRQARAPRAGTPRLINRAEGLLLESLVLATRCERRGAGCGADDAHREPPGRAQGGAGVGLRARAGRAAPGSRPDS